MSLVVQSCLTLCDPMDYSLPGSSVHGILQARILEWVAIPYPEIELVSLMSPTLAGMFFITATPGEVSTLQPHLSQLLHNGCPKGGHN